MIRIPHFSAVVLATSFAVLPQLASAATYDCRQWGLDGGAFEVVQKNGFRLGFELTQTGTAIDGSVRYRAGDGEVRGSVSGSLQGEQVDLTVSWGNGAKGLYKGTVQPTYSNGVVRSGSLKGYTVDLNQRGGAKVSWRSSGEMLTCLVLAKEESSPPKPTSPPVSPADKSGVLEKPAIPPPPPSSSGPWAAIAADGKGRWGYAVAQPSPDVARNAALQGCGDGACQILDALQARCIAYAESRANGGYWYFGHFGSDARSVENNAMSACWKAAPENSCALVKAVCG
jgi:hypothetical protein